MNNVHRYPSKILLIGEYSLLQGYEALGFPFRRFGASLAMPDETSLQGITPGPGNRVLEQYYNEWLCSHKELNNVLDIDRLGEDIRNGLYIEADIPVRRGIGSSGALCAAIYGTYSRNPINTGDKPDPESWRSLRSVFILMESWFHGRSSGFDPLLSYLDRPLRLQGSGSLVQADLQVLITGEMKVFLADTGKKEQTSVLISKTIKEFIQGRAGPGCGEELGELNNRCISILLDGHPRAFAGAVKDLSGFQLANMSWLIPGKVSEIWARGLAEDSFYLKLCGSGGGGFMLGFSPDPGKTAGIFSSAGLKTINVEPNNYNNDNNVD
jgi:mevalonate kinase